MLKDIDVRGRRPQKPYLYTWGHCQCAGRGVCPVTVAVKWELEAPNAHRMTASKRNVPHAASLAAPTGGALWDAELKVMRELENGKSRLKTKDIKEAFKQAQLKPRASNPQIRSNVNAQPRHS